MYAPDIEELFVASVIALLSALPFCDGQCSSSVEYQAEIYYKEFTSENYPYRYYDNANCLWILRAVNDTFAIRLDVLDAGIEYHEDCVYDRAQVYDGQNDSASLLGKFCGTSTPTYISNGNYMFVKFTSDYSLSAKGFKARYKSGERDSLFDTNEEESSTDLVAIIGGSIGGVVLLIIIVGVIVTYIQTKKAKRRDSNRRGQHRVSSRTRVQPFESGGYIYPTAPPAYGDFYSSPASPPPAYSEIDQNPNRQAALPGSTAPPYSSVITQQNPPPSNTGQNRGQATVTQAPVISDNNANSHFGLGLTTTFITRSYNTQNTGRSSGPKPASPLGATTAGAHAAPSVTTLTAVSNVRTSRRASAPNIATERRTTLPNEISGRDGEAGLTQRNTNTPGGAVLTSRSTNALSTPRDTFSNDQNERY